MKMRRKFRPGYYDSGSAFEPGEFRTNRQAFQRFQNTPPWSPYRVMPWHLARSLDQFDAQARHPGIWFIH